MKDHIPTEISRITKQRKLEHVRINLEEDVQARSITTFLEDIHLIHNPFPELNFDEIDLSTTFFGKKISLPIVCSGMTGGHKEVKGINETLARVAEKYNYPMGVGSQRAAIEDPTVEDTFSIVRDVAPNTFIIANLGAPQFNKGYGIDEVLRAVEMIHADAIAIHTNPLQEVVQPEGDRNFKNLLDKIEAINHELLKKRIPLIAKEVGSGFSKESAAELNRRGIQGIDIQGVGGTSWAAVEGLRFPNPRSKTLAEIFRDWGIPTAISTIEVKQVFNGTIIASGGVRNGLEVAKLIALGADVVGMASPFLKAAVQGTSVLENYVKIMAEEIKLACFLTGAKTIDDLKSVRLVITGKAREWLLQRGIDPKIYAQRPLKS